MRHREDRERKKWFNVPYILPTHSSYNPHTAGIPITDDGTGDIHDYYFPRPASELEGYPGIDFPSDFPPEGAISPCCHGRRPAKQYPHNEVWKQDEDNQLRRANICSKYYQET